MLLLRALLWRLYGFLFKNKIERRIDEEFRFHLDMRTKENIASGMTPEAASRDAIRRFGNRTYIAELARDIRGGGILDALAQDLSYGVRMLLKHPAFTAVAVITLALGIGANAAIFSVAHAVLLRPLPYDRPQELTVLWSSMQKMGASRAPASGIELREIRERSQLFSDIAGVWVANGTLTGEAEPEQVKVGYVTSNVFAVLGAWPSVGRSFLPEEEGNGARPAIILSYGLWVRRYGGDPNILGRTIRFEGGSCTVVGVMSRDFQLLFSPDANVPADVQIWVPFTYNIYADPPNLYYLRLIGRLKPGVTTAQAQDEANTIASQLCANYAAFGRENLKLEVVPLHGDAVRNTAPALVALLVGAGLVLLISCANVANLLLVRGTIRRREIALRAALGASHWRILRQLLIENLLLGFLGGALGLGLGWLALKPLLSLRPANLPQLDSVQLNPAMLGFVAALSLVSGLLCGLAPIFESRRLNLVETLKGTSGGGTRAGTERARSLLIVAEVALGFVLIVGAGLMVRTLSHLQTVDPGFNPHRVLTFEINLPFDAYPEDTSRINFMNQFEAALSALPEVESIGAISHLPFDDYPNWYSPYAPEGLSDEEKGGLLADHRAITAGFFQSAGARLIEGRFFDEHDKASGRNVVIVDDLMAGRTWPNESAVGKRLQVEKYNNGDFAPGWTEVVGVVEHIRSHTLMERGRGQIYIPFSQSARPHLSCVVKTRGDTLAPVATIRGELHRLDKDLALSKVLPMTAYLNKARARTDFTALLSSLFGGLALLLATVGIYGVVSYSAGQRTQEIGIRIALGARPVHVIKLVIGKGVMLTAAGVAIGLVAAMVLTRFMAGLLFGVGATDPFTFAAVTLLLVSVALLANYLPARRATKVDPMVALRCE